MILPDLRRLAAPQPPRENPVHLRVQELLQGEGRVGVFGVRVSERLGCALERAPVGVEAPGGGVARAHVGEVLFEGLEAVVELDLGK